jgi:pyruvate-formate lyase
MAGGIALKIVKYLAANRLYFRKVFMPTWASRNHCRNYGMMFMDQWYYAYDKGCNHEPFRKYKSTMDTNRKRHMKKKWKNFYRSEMVSSAYELRPMWWNGGEE